MCARAGVRNTGRESFMLTDTTPVHALVPIEKPDGWLLTGLHPRTPVLAPLPDPGEQVGIHEYGTFYQPGTRRCDQGRAGIGRQAAPRSDSNGLQFTGLVQYGDEEIPGTIEVVNPAWRALDKAVMDNRRSIRKLHAKLGAATLHNSGGDIQLQAETLQDIQRLEADTADLRIKRRATPRKVPIASLPKDQRPRQLAPLGKMLTDTVKMIAYRAETALVGLMRPHLAKEDEARALIRNPPSPLPHRATGQEFRWPCFSSPERSFTAASLPSTTPFSGRE